MEAFVRPHGLGQPATPVFADAVEALASAGDTQAAPGTEVSPWLRTLLWPLAAFAERDAAAWFVASERDAAIAARHDARRAREAEARRDKAERKKAQRRDKEARAAARQQHKAQRVAEWRRAKRSKQWKRRIDPGQ